MRKIICKRPGEKENVLDGDTCHYANSCPYDCEAKKVHGGSGNSRKNIIRKINGHNKVPQKQVFSDLG